MSLLPKRPASPPPSPLPTKPSGEHPAVQAFRNKLKSITEGSIEAVSKLDDELTAYLASIAPSSDDPPPSHR